MTQVALCPTTGMTKGSAVRMVSRFCLFAVLSQPLKTDIASKNLFQAAAQRT